jgi:DNA-binding NtrC family response regulator
MKGAILVVDDRALARHALASQLEGAGYSVTEASDGLEGWHCFCASEPDLVITDWLMPRCDGEALLRRIRSRSDIPVIVFSAHATLEGAVSTLKAGADEFLSASDVALEELVDLVDATVCGSGAGGQRLDFVPWLPGPSVLMQRVRSRLAGLAPLRSPVLVTGEEGLHRRAVIRALHELGSSAGGSLVTIDCARWRSARGLPKAAAVHLAGVEQLTASAQAFWLDQLRACERDGHRHGPRVLVTARPELLFGRPPSFSHQLRCFLARFPIVLPPLRERAEDVPGIADAMVAGLADRMDRVARLSEPSRVYLRSRPWPGNLAQLAQLLERAIAFSTGATIRRELLVELTADLEESVESIRQRHQAGERDALVAALHGTGGNVSRTAERLQRSRGAVYRLIEKHGISLSSSR